MRKYIIICFLLFISIISFAEERNALLIANGKYTSFSSLANPVPEAEALKKSLIELGFDVDIVINASKETMETEILNFQKKLQVEKGIGFFHYGGHAIQVNGENYLIPADADIPDEPRVSSRAVNLTEVMANMVADTNIVILDSCRNNPLPSGAGRSASRGLQMVKQKPKNSVIVYSAEPGKTAQDGVFTPILTEKILQNKDLISVLRDVRNEVNNRTNDEQNPGQYDQLRTEVYLARGIPSKVAKVEAENAKIKAEWEVLQKKKAQAKSLQEKQQAEIELQRVEAEAKRKALELQQVKEAEARRVAEEQRLAEENAKKNENQKLQEQQFAKMQAENAAKLKEIEQLQTDFNNIDELAKSANEIYKTINNITDNFTKTMNKAISDTKEFYDKKRDALVIGPWESDNEFSQRKKEIDNMKNKDTEDLKIKYQNEIESNTEDLKRRLNNILNRKVTVTGNRVKIEFGEYDRNKQCFPFTIEDTQNSLIKESLAIDVTSPDTETRNAKCQVIDNTIKSNGFIGYADYVVVLDDTENEYTSIVKSFGIKIVSTGNIMASKEVDIESSLALKRQEKIISERKQYQKECQLRWGETKLNPDFVFVEGNDKVSDFFICDHEVTQAEYMAVMGNNPSCFKGDNNPVENVIWYDAIEYCNKLSQKEGLTPCYIGSGDSIKFNPNANGYRLPTETEWEFAARGGNKSKGFKYSGSNNLGDVAWYNTKSGKKTHPIKQKLPNELGIYDMSGNVWEWCWDWYNDNNYPNLAKDYVGPGSGHYRVYRGGGYYNYGGGYDCAVDSRYYDYSDSRYTFLGFRLVRSSGK